MHVLFTRFPLESRFGGAEVQTLNVMKGLLERGHEVRFVGSCPTLLQAIGNKRREVVVKKLDIGPPPVTKWGVISFVWRKGEMKKKLISALEQELTRPNGHLAGRAAYPSERPSGRAGRLPLFSCSRSPKSCCSPHGAKNIASK